jgi:exocyst complex protein 7
MRQRASRKENELAEGLHALRGVCLRSFPETIADIKIAVNLPVSVGKQVEIGTSVAEITKIVGSVLLLKTK